MNKVYQLCSRCIMDTTDPDILFDKDEVCSHCYRYESVINSPSYKQKKIPGALDQLVTKIKKKGKGKKYDCVIGVSGGVDSTYTVYLAKQLGLRPLAVHLDNGWNTKSAVTNIENVLKKLNIDLYTHVLDWDEFKDLQLAFLRASTPDSEIPTDHAILAVLYMAAVQNKVSYVISGHNTVTEGGGVVAWSQGHSDWRYIRHISKIFGTRSLRSFPHYGIGRFLWYALIKQICWIPILDYIDYNKDIAIKALNKEFGWEYYGAKHHESIYTRFCQCYLLPKKFGFDKKRLHLSSLVWSGQITREEALKEMDKDYYPDSIQQEDMEFVIKKLGISKEELSQIIQQPIKSFWDYKSYKRLFHRNRIIMSIYHSLKRK